MLANKLQKRITQLDAKMEQKSSIMQMMFSIHESFRKFIQDQSLKKNWADYDELITKQLHYWAKTGEFEKFTQTVAKFNITVFKRVEVEYTENQRSTIANYHQALQFEEYSSSESLTFDDESMDATKTKKHKPKAAQRKRQDVDEFEYEY